MSYWIFQGNPTYWRVFDYLAKHGRGELKKWDWSARRYIDEIAPGDAAVLWMSGDRASRGVYAAGRVTGVPYLAPFEADEFWGNPADARKKRFHVPMNLEIDLIDDPILAVELIADARFHDASIVRQPRAANPHRLTKRQWSAIEDRLPYRLG